MTTADGQRFVIRVEQPDLPQWSARVDKYLTEGVGLLGRSQLQKRCRSLRVNGVEVKASRKIKHGDQIELELDPEPPVGVSAEDIELSVIFEDQDVVVINKPRGMVVHPGAGNWSGTLVHGLLFHVSSLSDDPDTLRPGIVHRLDKDTSGVMICAKHSAAKEFLSAQFAARRTRKRYVAITRGTPRPLRGSVGGTISRDPANRKRFRVQPAGGKPSRTDYHVARVYGDYALTHLAPRSGRTHQLRVHMAHLGTPILGDSLYSRADSRFSEAPLCLHALALSIRLPAESEARTFCAPIPADMLAIIKALHQAAAGNQGWTQARQRR